MAVGWREKEFVSRRLPVPLWPYQDEALWSWVLRLACFYAMSGRDFLSWIGVPGTGEKLAILYRDPTDALTEPLSTISGLPAETIKAMGLGGCNWASGAASDLAPRYCLHCLKRDRDRGRHDCLRRSWYLNGVTFCYLHGSPLVDHCLDCGRLTGNFVYDDGMIRLACRACEKVVDTSRIPNDEALFKPSLIIPEDEDTISISRRLMQAVRAFEEMTLAVLNESVPPDFPFPPTALQFRRGLSYIGHALSSTSDWQLTSKTAPYFHPFLKGSSLHAQRAQHAVDMIVLSNGATLPTLYPDYRSWTGDRAMFRAFCNVGGLYHIASRFKRKALRVYVDGLDPVLANEIMLAAVSQRFGLGWCGPMEPDRPEFLADCAKMDLPFRREQAERELYGAALKADFAFISDSLRFRKDIPDAQIVVDDPLRAAAVHGQTEDAEPTLCPEEARSPAKPAADNGKKSRAITRDINNDHQMDLSGQMNPEAGSAAPAKPPDSAATEHAHLTVPCHSPEALQEIINTEIRKRPFAFRTRADRRREVQRLARAIVDGHISVQNSSSCDAP